MFIRKENFIFNMVMPRRPDLEAIGFTSVVAASLAQSDLGPK